MMGSSEYLLTDAEVMHFVNHGYHLVEPDLPPGLHESIYEACSRLEPNPGNGIYDAIPTLREVYEHPKVRGALISLLGEDMQMNAHRHLHTTPARHLHSQTWHQDGTNVRHHQIRTVLAMYYPQEVTPENGPTVVLPGSHFRNAPTDRMATYANIRGQVFLTVKAGTVAITHYDIWHAATLNRSDRPRHMLKFLFDRKSEPVHPSWNHDPVHGREIGQRLISEMVGPPSGYTSDFYKEWELRKKMWNWLLGEEEQVPAGAFKDMLG
jgi:hypothetical protein